MSARLHLLRHAAAEPARALDADRARELTPGGRAALLSLDEALLHASEPPPTTVRCSPAIRAQQTLAELSWAADAHVLLDERLYSGSPEALLGCVADTPPETRAILLVGHNPTLSLFAAALLPPARRGPLRQGLPPGGLATLEVPDELGWAGLGAEAAALVRFYGG